MVSKLTVTVADSVYEYIEENKGNNRSELVEELIRVGIADHAMKKNSRSKIPKKEVRLDVEQKKL